MGIIILWMEKRVLIFHISTLFLMILTFPDIQTLPSEHIVFPYYKEDTFSFYAQLNL